MGKIKVTIISPTDISGGASIANYRLHKSLLPCSEIDSVLFVHRKYSEEKEIRQFFNFFLRIIEAILNKIGYFFGFQYLFSVNWLSLFLKRRFLQTNVFIIGNIHGGYLPFWFPYLLSKIAPVIWSVYDMWSFTGHCAYSYDCEKFKNTCFKCPYLKEYPKLFFDNTRILFNLKKFFYSRAKINIVCSSKWMKENIEKSPILKNSDIYYIPTAVDIDIFKPQEKYNKLSLIAVSAKLNDIRKGAEVFSEILQKLNEKLKEKNIFIDFYWIGKKDLKIGNFSNINNIFFGYLEKKELAEKYAKAHIFILPTLADNLPNTLLESLSSGTPAVCFDVGGCKDVVKHKETGYLVEKNNVPSFIDGVLYSLDNYVDMGKRGRELICRRFTMEQQKDKYLELISKILQ